jgi:cyclopropane-fatty-acyl-phospholipid synthase
MSLFRDRAASLLARADIAINGSRPWDLQVHNDALYGRVLREGSLGLGESYMDGWWDAERLDEFFFRLLRAGLDASAAPGLSLLASALIRFTNRQSRARAFQVGQEHYDLGNDLFEAMLDPNLVYTCGYWKDAETLEEAQLAKLDLICRKIGLEKGHQVLDIGCGWGSFAKFAAERYGAQVTGITVSKEQAELARSRTAGLPVEIRVEDYRETKGSFDRVLSVGMFEHVGSKNYRTYFEAVERLLKDDGLSLLHSIGGNHSVRSTDPWMDRYIFPNGMIPSIRQIGTALEGLFVMEDWHNFGAYYDKTLMAWQANFEAHWPELKERYSERFRRMWNYYLLACAGSFRARKNQLWQIVLSKHGVPGGYQRVS